MIEFAGDRSCRANAEEEVRSDTPPNNLNPAAAGFFFIEFIELADRAGLNASAGLTAFACDAAKDPGVIVEMGTAGEMARHHDGAHHHHEKSRGNEHQTDFSKCITIGHGRVSRYRFECSGRPVAAGAGGRLIA